MSVSYVAASLFNYDFSHLLLLRFTGQIQLSVRAVNEDNISIHGKQVYFLCILSLSCLI